MTPAFVADASVAIGWVHPAQATAYTAAMLDALAAGAALEVPALWPLEVANALTMLVRRRKLTEDERQTGLGWLRGLPLRIDHEMASLAFSRLSELAARHRLTIYDSAYLELAQRRRLPLACGDGPLRKVARQAGVGLWELPELTRDQYSTRRPRRVDVGLSIRTRASATRAPLGKTITGLKSSS